MTLNLQVRDNFIESVPGHLLFCPNAELGSSGPRQELELRRLSRGPLLRPRRRAETPEVKVVDGVGVVDDQRQGNVAENLCALSCAVSCLRVFFIVLQMELIFPAAMPDLQSCVWLLYGFTEIPIHRKPS